MYFYDTCALLEDLDEVFLSPFAISNITLQELEDIKTSRQKDDNIKAKARKVLNLLYQQQDRYTVYNFSIQEYEKLDKNIFLDNNDSKIISTALMALKEQDNIVFKTYDIACSLLAQEAGLKVLLKKEPQNEYIGFKEIQLKTEEEVINFYSTLAFSGNYFGLKENEYLLVYVNDTVDKYRFKNNKLQPLQFPCFESKQLGKIKPKDEYQFVAMDCLKHNQLSLLRGPAGSGKSYLAMGYFFELLEKGKIDKIIIFCNTVATLGSAKLGYYPGSKDEKLLDSQIGNFLVSKLGSKEEVEKKIAEGTIILLPMSDVRGYDTSGMNAGIYITEAQNLDIELMRLALQRIGEDSVCIIEGDDNTQVDSLLYAGARNGIKRVSEVFRGEEFFGQVMLKTIHRSKIAEVAQKM